MQPRFPGSCLIVNGDVLCAFADPDGSLHARDVVAEPARPRELTRAENLLDPPPVYRRIEVGLYAVCQEGPCRDALSLGSLWLESSSTPSWLVMTDSMHQQSRSPLRSLPRRSRGRSPGAPRIMEPRLAVALRRFAPWPLVLPAERLPSPRPICPEVKEEAGRSRASLRGSRTASMGSAKEAPGPLVPHRAM